MTQPSELITPKEAAARLRVTTQTLRAFIKDGRLEASKLGPRTIRISAAAIEKFMESAKRA